MDLLFYILIGVGVLILLVCLSIASYAGTNMMETYEHINKTMSSSYTVASDFAAMISYQYLDGKVKIGKRPGYLSDAYAPRNKVVWLSESVYGNSSVAALSIVAHEMGHALQDKITPELLSRRDNLSLLAKVLGFFMFPFFVAGIILFFVSADYYLYSLLCLGGSILIFFLALLVKGLTISIENDASKKAIDYLRDLRILEEDEIKLSKKLLKAALLTYIADFLQAVLGWTMLTRKTKLFR